MGPYVKIYAMPKYLNDYKTFEHLDITLILKINIPMSTLLMKSFVNIKCG